MHGDDDDEDDPQEPEHKGASEKSRTGCSPCQNETLQEPEHRRAVQEPKTSWKKNFWKNKEKRVRFGLCFDMFPRTLQTDMVALGAASAKVPF